MDIETPDEAEVKSVTVLVPDWPKLWDVMNKLPGELRAYRDNIWHLLSMIAGKMYAPTDRVQQEDGFIRLHSKILNSYFRSDKRAKAIRFLVADGILETSPHRAGHYSRGYRLTELPRPRRVTLRKRTLIKRIEAWRTRGEVENVPKVVRSRLWPALAANRRTIRASRFTEDPSDLARRLGIDASHASYIALAVQDGDAGVHSDEFGHRLHSIVTRMAKPLRQRLCVGQTQLVEIDVRNAQPLLLAIAMSRPDILVTKQRHAQPSQRNGHGHGHGNGHGHGHGHGNRHGIMLPTCTNVTHLEGGGESALSGLDAREVASFLRVCEQGYLYETIGDKTGLGRKDVKSGLWREVFFNDFKLCRRLGPTAAAFREIWPSIFQALKHLKEKHGYKVVARILQRLESRIVLQTACSRFLQEHPEAQLLTVHDSLMVLPEHAQAAEASLKDAFARYGAQVQLSRPPLAASGARTDTARVDDRNSARFRGGA
jgi:hypothetical protein